MPDQDLFKTEPNFDLEQVIVNLGSPLDTYLDDRADTLLTPTARFSQSDTFVDQETTSPETAEKEGLYFINYAYLNKNSIHSNLKPLLENKQEIGKGGMGTIYSTQALGKKYILKECPQISDSTPTLFKNEFEIQKLSHSLKVPVPEIYEAGLDPQTNNFYLIMEHLPGKTLAQTVQERKKQKQPLTFKEIVSRAFDLAIYLKTLGSNGISHGDLTPSNILIRENNQKTYLIDFGLATQEGEYLPPDQKAIRGTLDYMSPEILFYNGTPNPLSDQFGLGIILYELITGENPISTKGKNFPLTISEAGEKFDKYQNIKNPSEITDYPPDLDNLVMRCLSFKPESRFPFQELANQLKLFLLY